MTTPDIPVGVEDVQATVANFRLYQFKKRLDDMRLMMQTARGELDKINDLAKQNVEKQRAINANLEESKRKREELLDPKPTHKKPHLYFVK